jgi:hypothetical protein
VWVSRLGRKWAHGLAIRSASGLGGESGTKEKEDIDVLGGCWFKVKWAEACKKYLRGCSCGCSGRGRGREAGGRFSGHAGWEASRGLRIGGNRDMSHVRGGLVRWFIAK